MNRIRPKYTEADPLHRRPGVDVFLRQEQDQEDEDDDDKRDDEEDDDNDGEGDGYSD